jgi:hypothetical protein
VRDEEPSPSSQSPSKRRRTGAAAATQDHAQDVDEQNAQRKEAEHYAWMERWLQARKARGEELLTSLETFTGWEFIKLLSQQKPSLGSGGKLHIRYVAIHGRMRQIGQVTLKFAIEDNAEEGPPRVVNLEVELPSPVKEALEREGHLRRYVEVFRYRMNAAKQRCSAQTSAWQRCTSDLQLSSQPRICRTSATTTVWRDLHLPSTSLWRLCQGVQRTRPRLTNPGAGLRVRETSQKIVCAR